MHWTWPLASKRGGVVEGLAVKQWCLRLTRGHAAMLSAVSSRGVYVVSFLAVVGELVEHKGTMRDPRENYEGTIGEP